MRPGIGIVEAEEKLDDRGLAGAVQPDQTDLLRRLDRKGAVLQNRCIAVRIAERDMIEFDFRILGGDFGAALLFDYRKVVELMHFADEVIVFGIVCDQRHKITHLRSQRAHHAEVVLQITDSDLLTDYVEYGGDDDQEIARQIDDLHQNGEYLVLSTLFSVESRVIFFRAVRYLL